MVHQFIHRYQKIIYILFAAILIVLLLNGAVAFIRADAESRERFYHIKSEMEQVATKLKSVDAIERTDLAIYRGNGVIGDRQCWPDESCPFITKYWLIPVETNDEQNFIKGVLNKNGFITTAGDKTQCNLGDSTDCSLTAEKDNIIASITIYRIDNPQLPKEDVSPKVWRRVAIRIGLNEITANLKFDQPKNNFGLYTKSHSEVNSILSGLFYSTNMQNIYPRRQPKECLIS